MKIMLDEGAHRPERAHAEDAGLDLKALGGGVVPAHGAATFRTGVHVMLPPGTAGLLISKSGLNVKHSITSTGLIDEGYTGEIMVRLINNGEEAYIVNDGDKITQLVIINVWRDPKVEVVDCIETGAERGNDGFGSTGR